MVAEYLIAGRSLQSIAQEYGLSLDGVQYHVRRALKRGLVVCMENGEYAAPASDVLPESEAESEPEASTADPIATIADGVRLIAEWTNDFDMRLRDVEDLLGKALAVAGTHDRRKLSRARPITLNVRPEVARFAELMERKLAANDWKRHWSTMDDDEILRGLSSELRELYKAIAFGEPPQNIALEMGQSRTFGGVVMADTKIEWATKTWNPITGCTKISVGCQNCYAERMSKRLAGRYGYDKDNPFKVTLHPDRLGEPLKWRKPQMVFVCSMGDLFHKDVDRGFLCRMFDVMIVAEQHTFLILTKRPGHMKSFVGSCVHGVPSNIWLGVTAENQETANKRIPILLQIPAAKRFVSVEPMLGPVDLTELRDPQNFPGCMYVNGLGGKEVHEDDDGNWLRINKLNWVICGGETGPGARPMHPEWARGLRDQCVNAGVPFFFKSWGDYCYVDQMSSDTYAHLDTKINLAGHGEKAWKVGKRMAGRLLDNREWNERPEV